ncbi:hypothetical protein BH09MYX1_BH09MYX1_36700 [soil metagenome]
MTTFAPWFERLTDFPAHAWQREVGEADVCRDRILRVPTGFGKTAGVVLPWLFHRVAKGNRAWPARLIFCLPMRVLVEQTERAIIEWLAKAGLHVPVVVLLGGRHESTWLERPDAPTIIVGTQDMLLSRALARGYGSSRGLWPMEMGTIHNDALWIFDEVQLMDVGLATSTQLHAFRTDDAASARGPLRRSFSWWMSATLQPRWLESVDFTRMGALAQVPSTRIGAELRDGGLWDVRKSLDVRPHASAPEEVASTALTEHRAGTTTLVIVNTVDRARKVEAALGKGKGAVEVRLVHSRFRGAERRGWDFLSRKAAVPEAGRIIVSTQVVEAGVDLSAASLVTDLAPWPSLVQRFGRCARYAGEAGRIVVVGAPPAEARKAAPYELEELAAAAEALARITSRTADVGPRTLENIEDEWLASERDFLERLYPYAPLHVLRRRDFDDLFDTTPDLSGADLDVSRYIRSGDERDVSVFWRSIENSHVRSLGRISAPSREELCPVPVAELRDVLTKDRPGFVHDYLSGDWRRVERIVPGMTVLLDAARGGYDIRRGWDPKSQVAVGSVEADGERDVAEETSASADDDGLSQYPWKTIATHGRETGQEAQQIARSLALGPSTTDVLELAGRWHDSGKAHRVFQDAIKIAVREESSRFERDLAKAPESAWRRPPYPERPGFRHELVSTLLLFEVLRRAAPDHPAVLGAQREVLAASGVVVTEVNPSERIEHLLASELAALSSDNFDLLAYLVCAHHGKVRTSWSSTPRDQEAEHGGIHGVCEGDHLDEVTLCDRSGARSTLPRSELSLACAAMGLNGRFGASWGERVAGLLSRYGPFGLAYLESLFRVADWRASRLDTPEHQ